MSQLRVYIRRNPLGRWYVAKATVNSPELAWSGSYFVPSHLGIPTGGVQVSNLDTKERAAQVAREAGFEVVRELTPAKVLEVFRKIANGERLRGDFLTTFARSYLLADAHNKSLMYDATQRLIEKYSLEHYADEPHDPSDGELIRGAIPPTSEGS